MKSQQIIEHIAVWSVLSHQKHTRKATTFTISKFFVTIGILRITINFLIN